MFSRLKSYWKNFDWIIFAPIFLLVVFGLLEIYSVALGQENVDFINFKKQLFFAAMGFFLLFVFAFWSSSVWKNLSPYLYWLGALLLLILFIFGHSIRGHQSWFALGGFKLQPVEFAKIILILFLSKFFSDLATRVKQLRHFVYSALAAGIFIVLVLLQPDLGSALILGSIWLIIVIAAGFNRRYFLIVGLILAVVSIFSWFFLLQDYQKERLFTFLNPTSDALESGYNISQAMIAIGSGGLTGQGIGFGSQSQLKFLPEAHTDFIFSVVAEELGFLGVSLILAFYFIFFFRCFKVMKKINNDFGLYFLIGGAGLIFIQMFINIGMNMGIMPVVGLPLPFISYGGSSLISLLILVGMIENIIIKSRISY